MWARTIQVTLSVGRSPGGRELPLYRHGIWSPASRSLTKVAVPRLDTSHKLILDPIHGNIPLTRLEAEILELPALVRLHDLKQNGLAYLVYPGAVSTRFTHAIGTMHLASQMAYQLLESMERGWLTELFPDYSQASELPTIVQLVRLAGLLHDVGHGPFSHTTETVMQASLSRYHPQELKGALHEWKIDEGDLDRFPAHEYFSKRLITDGAVGQFLDHAASHPGNFGPYVPDRIDVASLISKTSNGTGGLSEEGRKVLRAVISSEVDADRMDFLLRDSYSSGLIYGQIDPERLISQVSVKKSEHGRFRVSFNERAVAGLEDFLDARYKMYKWLAGHHMVVTADLVLRRACLWGLGQELLSPETFYWKGFDAGGCSDSRVLSVLASSLEGDKKSPYRGLVNRAYLPLSLMKRLTDFVSFEEQVQSHLGATTPPEMLADAVTNFIFNSTNNPRMNVDGTEVYIFAIANRRTPYSPASGQSAIWTDKGERDHKASRLTELSQSSPYVFAIGEAWRRFPSYQIAYCVPGQSRASGRSLSHVVLRKIVEKVAECCPH